MKSISYGYKNYYTPHSKIYHVGSHSKSNNHPHMAKNKSLFKMKWFSNSVIKGYLKNLENGEAEIEYDKIRLLFIRL